MPTLSLTCADLSLGVATDLGGGLTDFSIAGPDARAALLRPTLAHPETSADLACYTLAPWSNRIRDARFRFRGVHHRLTVNAPDGTAHHGLVSDHPMTIVDRTPASVRLAFDSAGSDTARDYPFPFRVGLRYELGPDRLDAELTVTNAGEAPCPAGGGFHPFFPRTLWDTSDDCALAARVEARYPAERCLPTGPAEPDGVCARLTEGAPVRDLVGLDDCFRGFAGATIRWPASGVTLSVETSATLGHLVLYTPGTPTGGARPWFCVEPVSHANDGFNLAEEGVQGTGVRTLEPGETLTMSMALIVARDPD